MKHQILIASYQKDFPWLRQCLRSLEKFSTGFLPPVVAVPSEDLEEANAVVAGALRDCDRAGSVHVRVWDGPGFGRAQEAMQSADLLCPHATHFWLLGSDCMAVRHFSPADYCAPDGKPYMLWHSWDHIQKHAPQCYFWRAGVEEALGGESHGEFMRILPLGYPTKILEPMRKDIADRHGIRFTPYVLDRVNRVRNYSESNVMGEWCWRHHRDEFHWINLDEGMPDFRKSWTSPVRQGWSWADFDRPSDTDGRTAREVILEVLGSL